MATPPLHWPCFGPRALQLRLEVTLGELLNPFLGGSDVGVSLFTMGRTGSYLSSGDILGYGGYSSVASLLRGLSSVLLESSDFSSSVTMVTSSG